MFPSRHRPRARRRLAHLVLGVLAAGVVIGVGISPTLASWVDAESATSEIGTSVFAIESRTATGDTFADHHDTAAALTFAGGDLLIPGGLAHAWVDIRTTAATTRRGDLVLSESTLGGPLSAALSYRISATSATDAATLPECTAASFTDQPFVSGTTLAAITGTVDPKGASTTRMCVEVRLDSTAANTLQGQPATWDWTFTGTPQ